MTDSTPNPFKTNIEHLPSNINNMAKTQGGRFTAFGQFIADTPNDRFKQNLNEEPQDDLNDRDKVESSFKPYATSAHLKNLVPPPSRPNQVDARAKYLQELRDKMAGPDLTRGSGFLNNLESLANDKEGESDFARSTVHFNKDKKVTASGKYEPVTTNVNSIN